MLAEILAGRTKSVEEAKSVVPLRELEVAANQTLPPIPFGAAIHQADRISVIAEMKRKSPSAGVLRQNYNAAEIARAYEAGGAAAISVLTEPDMFGGKTLDMVKVRSASRIPILCKDFIFDRYQIVEARVRRADAVLLISDMLSAQDLQDLVRCANDFGLETLVEAFTREALDAALKTKSKMIGLNTRDLRTLEMKPENVVQLVRDIPNDRIIVAESGIRVAADIERLKPFRISAVLVGESLLKQMDLTKGVQMLAVAGELKK